MELKKYLNTDVLTMARKRIKFLFNNFENIFLSFSGGKDSTVMFHLVIEEAIKRNRIIGIMLIDFEAQYTATSDHAKKMFNKYSNNIEVFWICLPIALRNAVSTFEPKWICWDKDKKDMWVRQPPKEKGVISDINYFPFFQSGMEFEEFIILFAEWYKRKGNNKKTIGFVGIRCDESLNRFRTIAQINKKTYKNRRYTTKIMKNVYNAYPIYDWKTSDIWKYHACFPELEYNSIYELMQKAGVSYGNQRLCQPYGDDQRKGLWLYHILEPSTWYKVIARVNGVNTGALYITERGNINGINKIYKPSGHTYKSFCNLLLSTMPKKTREHFIKRFTSFLENWKKRGYSKGIPDEAPKVLEDNYWVPSWKRLCKVLLRNDWWCKGLGVTQPKSEAYGKYLKLKKQKTER